MGDFNNPNDNNNQQNNPYVGDNQNQQPNPYQQPGYGGQNQPPQYGQPQNQQQYGQQPQYQQPGYNGQSQYQQPNPYQQPYNQYQQQPKKDNGMAIGSLVCGIVSVVLCCVYYLALPVAVVAIVLGILTIKNKKDGRTMAIIGIILGGLGVIIGILGIIGCSVLINDQNFWENISNGDWSSYYD